MIQKIIFSDFTRCFEDVRCKQCFESMELFSVMEKKGPDGAICDVCEKEVPAEDSMWVCVSVNKLF